MPRRDDLAHIGMAQGATQAEDLIERADCLPDELSEKFIGRLLNQRVF